jgi:MYXO-CTERM domain-containing protein
MKRLIFSQFILGAFILGSQVAQAAGTTGLFDWCVNLNGDINTACNGAGGGGVSTNADGGTINLVSFDSNLEPALNGLGSVSISLGVGNGQSALFYADYDLDFATLGAFDDTGTTVGALPAGVSYELDDPNVSNIFNDFAGDTLANTNNVGSPAGPTCLPIAACDVSFALGLDGLNVAPGGTGTVTFTIGTVAPASGFYIQQTNATVGDSIYLSAVANIQNPTGGATPEPSTFALAIGSLGLVLFLARRRRANA